MKRKGKTALDGAKSNRIFANGGKGRPTPSSRVKSGRVEETRENRFVCVVLLRLVWNRSSFLRFLVNQWGNGAMGPPACSV